MIVRTDLQGTYKRTYRDQPRLRQLIQESKAKARLYRISKGSNGNKGNKASTRIHLHVYTYTSTTAAISLGPKTVGETLI